LAATGTTGCGTAAARRAGRRRADGLTAGAFGDEAAGRHEFADLIAFTFGAFRDFLTEYQLLELVSALLAVVLEDGHWDRSLVVGGRAPAQYCKTAKYNDYRRKIKTVSLRDQGSRFGNRAIFL
jgi:hypothetical protein